MEKYDSYKDSGVEWIGEIPREWSMKSLKFIVDENVSSLSNNTEPNYELDYIEISDVNSIGNINKPTPYFFSESPSRCRRIVKKGDVIISTVRTYLKSIGIIDYEVKNLICSTGFSVLTPKEKTLSKHLFYMVRSGWFISDVISKSVGVSYPSIQSEKLMNIKVLSLPIPEQQQIVSFLDTKTQQIDTLLEKTQQKIKLLKEQRTSLINHVVTKGLNPNVELKDSGIEWIGEIPIDWKIVQLKHIIRNLNSGTSVNSEDIPVNGTDKLGVLKTSCVYGDIFRFEENKTVVLEEYDRVKCPVLKDSIIISRMNTPELVGSNGYIETDYPNLFLPDRLWITKFYNKNVLSVKWLSYITKSNKFRSELSSRSTGTSSSMKNITKDDLLTIRVPFFSLFEQQQIVDYLDKKTTLIDNTITTEQKRIELLKEYRQSLISNVVTGKIKVTNDE